MCLLKFINTRAYGATKPEPLGFALHRYLLTEESVTDKQIDERKHIERQLLIQIWCFILNEFLF